MKKFRFAFFLAIVSVFSVAAQTNYQSTVNPSAIENAQATTTAAVATNARIADVTATLGSSGGGGGFKTKVLQEKQLRVSDPINLLDSSILTIAKSSLGRYSTGNPSVDSYIEEYSALYNVDPLLIYAQMYQESRFRPRATSPKGASGFMQLMPDTARRFGVKNIYDPKQNIKAGVRYMRWLIDNFDGDVRLALAGYNAGEGAVKKYGNQIPPYRETQNYVAKIMKHYQEIVTEAPAEVASPSITDAVATGNTNAAPTVAVNTF